VLQTEVHNLKQTIAKLAAQLEHYHHLKPLEAQLVQEFQLELLSGHLLAPLFHEYEATIKSQEHEIKALQLQLQKSIDSHKELLSENGQLISEL